MPIEKIIESIKNLDNSTIKMVAFTGGEAFLLGKRLAEVVNQAKQKGFITRVVTSAYWAKDLRKAEKHLMHLRKAGLDQLSISWDDFHESQTSIPISFDFVYNAFWAAKKLGITTAINIVQAENSKWTADKVKEALGLDTRSKDVIVESPLNLTGRAEEELKSLGKRPARLVGPCPYVLTGPTLSAKNKLLACCGVIPHTQALVLDEDYRPENLNSAIQEGLHSPLLNWLHLRGPYAIMKWISDRYGVQIPEIEDVGGNCEACRVLFHTEEISSLVPYAVAEKANEIEGELHVLKALGFLEPKEDSPILDLWMDKSTVAATAT